MARYIASYEQTTDGQQTPAPPPIADTVDTVIQNLKNKNKGLFIVDCSQGVHESSLHVAPLGIGSCRTFCSDLTR